MYLRSTLLSLSALVAAKEVAKDQVKAAKLYDSGIKHQNNIALKMVRAVFVHTLCLALTFPAGDVWTATGCGRL